jgi:hypothetical protein
MHDSYPFPVYSGLMEPKHYKKIGSAIWLFLWCISSTTEEVEKDGSMWGIVLGNKPVKISELQEVFGVKSDKTIRNWIDTLEMHNYINVTRSPYGLIISVNKSKKFSGRSVENYRSGTVKNYRSDVGDRQEITDLAVENYRSNKDITEINNAATTDEKAEFEKVFTAFCEIHRKLDIHVKPLDITLMTELTKKGIPAALIVKVMRTVHDERTAQGAKISSFAYYKQAILDAWAAEKAITEGVPVPEGVPLPPVALGQPQKRISKAEYFRQKAREAREREAGRSVDAL